jgi:uncharacterized protein involved in exopolysaccharide biosynthesis
MNAAGNPVGPALLRELPPREPPLLRAIAALRRAGRLFTFVAVAVLIAAAAAAFLWPASYRSTGTILIEQQEVPAELVRSTISSYADQRIQVITQRVMTTENLLGIVNKYGLYARQRRFDSREQIVARMRRDVRFQMISADVIDPRAGRPTKATIAFSVSYQNRSPEVAARVANELVSLYLSENVDSRRQSSADAASFLGDETTRLAERSRELEQKIADFRTQHLNDLPELSQLNLQVVSRTESEVTDVDTQVRALDQQIVFLDAQLVQLNPTAAVISATGERVLSGPDRLKFLRAEYARVNGIYSAEHPDVLRLQREIRGLEEERDAGTDTAASNDLRRGIEAAEAELASARERYAASHPDVVRLQRQLEALRSELGQEAGREARLDASAAADADNPAYIQIRAQREAAVTQRRALLGKRAELNRRRQEYEDRLAASPAVAREYSELARELEATQLKYREVSQRQMEAQLSATLEEERKGERFTLIEPPLTPEEPSSPNRVLILALGWLLALGGGGGSVALRESLDTSIRGASDLERLLGVAPLAVVGRIRTQAELRALRRRRWLLLAAVLLLAVLAVLAVHLWVRPLDVLWHQLLRRLGV